MTPTKPPRVDYALTDMGREVLGPVRALAGWALGQADRINKAKRRYDARSAGSSTASSGRLGRLCAQSRRFQALRAPPRSSHTVGRPRTGLVARVDVPTRRNSKLAGEGSDEGCNASIPAIQRRLSNTSAR